MRVWEAESVLSIVKHWFTNRKKTKEDRTEELIKQIKYAEERYFAEQEAREKLEQALEELKEKSRLIEEYSKQLSKERDTLEIRVNEKTRDLEIALNKMEKLNDFRSRFFINLTHELRTPLTLIRMSIEKYRSGQNKTGTNFESLDFSSIYKQTDKMLFLINNILTYSQMDQSALVIDMKSVSAKLFFDSVFNGFCNIISSSGPKVEYISRIDNEILISIDSSLLDVAISNIIMNALKFTPPDGFIQIITEVNKESLLELRVLDSGHGIPDDMKTAIFDRYFQINSSTSGTHEGIGIGLAIANEIVQLHNGAIFVEDSMLGGSEFIMQLPIIKTQLEVVVDEGYSLKYKSIFTDINQIEIETIHNPDNMNPRMTVGCWTLGNGPACIVPVS